jgi:cytoskeletal protein RodZ
MSDQPKDVGQVLKAEREKRAMTLEVIHEATKIPLDSLRAIEEGYKIRTLSTFYYKSFIKIYAHYLGLDPHEVLALVPGSQTAPKKAFVEEPSKPKIIPLKPVSAPKSFKLPAANELNLFAGPVKKDHVKKAAVIVGGVLAVFVVIFLISTVISSVRKHLAVQSALSPTKKKSAKTSKAKSTPAKNVETVNVVTPAKGAVPAPAPAETVKRTDTVKPVKTAAAVGKPVENANSEAAQAVKTPKKATLAVRAPITVWLKVRVDGSMVYQGSLKKGNFESWSGSKKIELSGKGIAQLELEVNGKNVGKLGRPDTNAKKIIVTPEGMSIEK